MRAGATPAGILDRDRPDRFALLATAIAVALLALPMWGSPWSIYDGGISSSAATFTLHGLLPYRDYWLLYGPLSGWLLAIPTAIVGPSVELTRLVGLLFLACQAAIVYGLCRRWTEVVPAFLLAASSSSIVAAFGGLDFNAWTLSMTLGLLALSLRLDGRRPFVVGVLLGLAFLARLLVPDGRRRMTSEFPHGSMPEHARFEAAQADQDECRVDGACEAVAR